MTLLALPTTRDEEWRYADPEALAQLAPADLDVWHEAVLAPGETRSKTLILDEEYPGLHRVRLTVGAGARAEIFAVASASAYTRLEVEVRLARGAHFQFGGVTIGGGDATREFITRTVHAEPEATSHQVVRAVHWGSATGNFLGRIDVARDAQKTDAAQDFKGLLLERGASANAKPELEIFADDVKCAHGCAIGELDPMGLYYLQSRGLPPGEAKKLMLQAFVAGVFDGAEDEARLQELALAKLGELV